MKPFNIMESLLCFSISLSLLYCVECCGHVCGGGLYSVCCEGAAGYHEDIIADAAEYLTGIAAGVSALGYDIAVVLRFVVGQYLELGDGAVLVNDIHDVYRAAVTEGGGGHCVVSGALAGEAVCAVYGGLNAGGYESCYLSVLVHLDDTLDVLLTWQLRKPLLRKP